MAESFSDRWWYLKHHTCTLAIHLSQQDFLTLLLLFSPSVRPKEEEWTVRGCRPAWLVIPGYPSAPPSQAAHRLSHALGSSTAVGAADEGTCCGRLRSGTLVLTLPVLLLLPSPSETSGCGARCRRPRRCRHGKCEASAGSRSSAVAHRD